MKQDTIRDHYARISKVLCHLSTNLDKPNSIGELARIACFAPFHFHRVFRQVTGEAVHRYLRRVRLLYSAYYLLFSARTILEIALQVGYQTHESFTRSFQQALGCAPSQFRARRGQAQPSGESTRLMRETLMRQLAGEREYAQLPFQQNEPQRVVFSTHLGDFSAIPGCWRSLLRQLRQSGLAVDEWPCIGVVYDDPMQPRESGIRYDACVVVPPGLALAPDINVQMLPSWDFLGMHYEGHHGLSCYPRMTLAVDSALTHDGSGPMFPYREYYAGFPFIGDSQQARLQIQVPRGCHRRQA